MLELSIEAANLLGRWTRVSQLHAEGCSCCGGGFGNVSMRTEQSLLAYLRESHSEAFTSPGPRPRHRPP